MEFFSTNGRFLFPNAKFYAPLVRVDVYQLELVVEL